MEDKKKYICQAATNGIEVGAEVFMTEAEAANINAGEETPRFVLADDQAVAEAPAPADDGQAANDQAEQQQGNAGDMSGGQQ